MLYGRELVEGPDFKPLVLRHTEEPSNLKLNVEPIKCKLSADPFMVVNKKPADETSVAVESVQQPRPTPGAEAVHVTANSRQWTTGLHHLQPPSAAEAVQFRVLQYRELTPEDYDLLCLLDESIPKKSIASPSAVARLPRIPSNECSATECHVCFARLEPGTRVVPLPCGHAFHSDCISKWLTQCRGTCPLCNSGLEAEAKPQDKTVAASSQPTDKSKNVLDLDSAADLKAAATAVTTLARPNIARLGNKGFVLQPGAGDEIPAE